MQALFSALTASVVSGISGHHMPLVPYIEKTIESLSLQNLSAGERCVEISMGGVRQRAFFSVASDYSYEDHEKREHLKGLIKNMDSKVFQKLVLAVAQHTTKDERGFAVSLVFNPSAPYDDRGTPRQSKLPYLRIEYVPPAAEPAEK